MKKLLRHLEVKDLKETRQRQTVENRLLQLEKKEKEIQEQEDREFLEPFKSNWRKELQVGNVIEAMTTSALTTVTLPATGDVEYFPTESEQNTVSAGPFVSATAVFDTSRYDTMIVDVEVYDEVFAVLDADQNFLFTTFDGSGTYSFRIPQGKNQLFYFAGPDDSEVEPLVFKVTGIRFQRRTPLNVFVGLDDPEATSFMRTGNGNLTAEQRKQKLKEMLEASDGYLTTQFGENFPGTKLDPKVGEAGDTPNVEIAQSMPFQLRPDGTSGYNKPGDTITDPASGKKFKLNPSGKYGGGYEWQVVRQA